MKRKALCFLLLLCALLSGCGKETKTAANRLRFSDTVTLENLTKLSGKQVTIIGYMATLSPISGEFMYLMNMPLQSCPFCVPNTQQLANTLAVYAPKGKSFTFTEQAVQVTGKLEMGSFTDEYGYEYNYRIVDATLDKVDLTAVTETYKLWQSLSEDGTIAEVYTMFDYLYFITHWDWYYQIYEDETGAQTVIWAGPADVYLCMSGNPGMDFSKEATKGYIDGLVKRVKAVSETELNELVRILNGCEELNLQARSDLDNNAFTQDAATGQYTLNNNMTFDTRYNELWYDFCMWLTQWEL